MDWKQETILTLMGIPVIATMVYGISEFVEKKIRDITSNDGNSFIKAFIFNYMENIIVNLYINKIIFIIYIISTKLSLILSCCSTSAV